MALTKANLIPRLRSRLSSTTDDALLTASSLLEDLNNGIAAFAEERDWPWLEATGTIALVAGTDTYDLPDGLTRIHMMTIDDAPVLEEVQYRDLLRWQLQAPGTPRYYATVAGTVVVAPMPISDSTISIFYQQEDAVLVGDSDSCAVPTRYASVLLTFAAIYAAIRIQDQNLTNALYKLKDDEVNRTMDALQRSSVPVKISTRQDSRL